MHSMVPKIRVYNPNLKADIPLELAGHETNTTCRRTVAEVTYKSEALLQVKFATSRVWCKLCFTVPGRYALDVEVGEAQLYALTRQTNEVVDAAEIARVVVGVVGRIKRAVLQRIDVITAVYCLIAICKYRQHTQFRQSGNTITPNKWSREFSEGRIEWSFPSPWGMITPV